MALTQQPDLIVNLDQILNVAGQIVETAKTASRNGKSLAGDNHYGNKFHDHVVALTSLEERVGSQLRGIGLDESAVITFHAHLQSLKSTAAVQKSESYKAITLFINSIVKPRLEAMTASPVPLTEQVLPLSVVRKTRTYLERVITQANGCYEHQWFDASSVMIRRFVETMIIELYEGKKKEAALKDNNGDYFMLSKLIDVTLADSSWNLGRESKRVLPLIKSLGDRSAHNRRYVATKQDVDEILPGLRVLADDLLHLARLK